MSASSDDDFIDEELTEFIRDPADQENLHGESLQSSLPKKRGRKRIAERWSGVISIDHDDLSKIKLRDLATDLKMSPNISSNLGRSRRAKWKP